MSLAHAVVVALSLLGATDHFTLGGFGSVALAQSLRLDNAGTVSHFAIAPFVLEGPLRGCLVQSFSHGR